MKTKRTLWAATSGVLGTAMLLLLAVQAQALTLEPDDCELDEPGKNCWTADDEGFGTANLGEDNVRGIVGNDDLVLMFKADFGGGNEGLLDDDYEASFSGDPNDATIMWLGPDAIDCPTCILEIKDGNEEPFTYLFDLDSFGWDGTETIEMEGFFPGNGAISHVALWGAESTSVPAPGALALIGLGLLGLGLMRRRLD